MIIIITHDKNDEEKMEIGHGYGMGIGGYNKLCPMATRLRLVTLFSLSMSIEDHPLLWMVVRSQTYYPNNIPAYGSGKARYTLVVCFGSFRTDGLEAGKGEGLSTRLRPGLKCGGLESMFGRGPRPRDRSGMGWSCLCLGYKWSVYFRVPSWDTLVHESPFP